MVAALVLEASGRNPVGVRVPPLLRMSEWKSIKRPGYFGRRRDERINEFNTKYGEGNWRLAWILPVANATLTDPLPFHFTFEEACRQLYEESYFQYFKDRPEDIDYACQFGECIDNAITNVNSGRDYLKQEAFSTHIQDIALRNVLHRLGRKFEGPPDLILTIRSKDTDGIRFGPGEVPFFNPDLIMTPSLCPKWAGQDSVEDFWQSNKWLQIKESQLELMGSLEGLDKAMDYVKDAMKNYLKKP